MLSVAKKFAKAIRNRLYGLEKIKPEFKEIQFAGRTLQKLLNEFEFKTVLDIGSGAGQHTEMFIQSGKDVTAIDYGDSIYFRNNKSRLKTIVADFNEYKFDMEYDCIWCSHVLEHQLNVNIFLQKIYSLLKTGGILAISVPPLKHEIVGGHVSLWNPGLLLYNLVLAGFDCSNAKIINMDYNISIIVEKQNKVNLDEISFDSGDIRKIKQYLPKELKFNPNQNDDPFNGNIRLLNW